MTTLVGEPRRHLALRARVSVTFALISLLLTALLAATTYFLARTYMLDQRERSATRQVFLNARLVKSELTRDEAADVGQALEQLQGELNSTSLIFVDQRWYHVAVLFSVLHAELACSRRAEASSALLRTDPLLLRNTDSGHYHSDRHQFEPVRQPLDQALRGTG